MVKLGEIKKPSVGRFVESRKLFCLPLIPQFPTKESGEPQLDTSIKLFWQQASSQLAELERTGKILYVFYESITADGESGLDAIRQVNEKSYSLVKEKVGQGAKLVALEDEETFNEYLDWTLCLSVARKSSKVIGKIMEFQREAAKRRYKCIAKKISETLKSGEAALLVMAEETRLHVQPLLPSDVQVFLVRPPALNEIERWIRDYLQKQIKTRNRQQ